MSCFTQEVRENGKTLSFEGMGPSSERVQLHERCFEAYQKRTGLVCPRCGDPLWRRNNSAASGSATEKGGFRKRTCFVAAGGEGERTVEVHAECGDRCAHCNGLLAAEKLGKKSRATKGRRRGSVIMVEAPPAAKTDSGDAAATVQLHSECFIAFKSTIPSETCSRCGSCLWAMAKDNRFTRRASILTRGDGVEESLYSA